MFTNRLLAIAAAGVLATAGLAQAQEEVEITFNETSPGTWDVLAEVTTEGNRGLSSYDVTVAGTPATDISYAQNSLSTTKPSGANVGFAAASKGAIGEEATSTRFNAGSFQNAPGSDDAPILDIGKEPVQVDSLAPSVISPVDLEVPALLGTFTTPEGLTAENFQATAPGLFNAAGDGFYQGTTNLTTTVNPIPEPTSLALLGLGGLALFTRRKRA